jgi:EpsD family peptidyl-prolyl cis-trans isomerase
MMRPDRAVARVHTEAAMTARSCNSRRVSDPFGRRHAGTARPAGVRSFRLTAALAAALAVAACGGGGGGEKKASQVVAKVNDDELSVHQINFVLQRTPGIPPERAAEARKEVLERLIDQELAVQRAKASKLDRDAEIMQRLEAARREVLARAYMERVAAQVPKPDANEVAKFFADNPALFAERRIWRLNEIVLPGQPPNWAGLAKQLALVKTAAEAADLLRRAGIDSAVATNVARGSEGIPLELLPKFAKLKDGEVAIFQNGPQLVIAEIRSSQPAPLDAKQAGPAIEQFIMNRRRTDAAQSEMKRLRDGAKIEYKGDFAQGAAAPAAKPAPKAPDSEKGAIERGIGGLK